MEDESQATPDDLQISKNSPIEGNFTSFTFTLEKKVWIAFDSMKCSLNFQISIPKITKRCNYIYLVHFQVPRRSYQFYQRYLFGTRLCSLHQVF